VSLAVGRTTWNQLEEYTFQDYVQEFSKIYSTNEYKLRQSIFDARLTDIKRHNADGSKSYKRGVNQFSDLTLDEFKRFLGSGPGPKSLEGEVFKPTVPQKDLPPTVDWRTKGVVTPVKNQGSCGSCWAFAATETIESIIAIKTGQPPMILSEQNMVSCTPNPQQCGGTGGCGGATAELGYTYVQKMGLASEKVQPYRGVTGKCVESAKVANITGYVKIAENSHDDLMNAVATVGPIAITVAASGWMDFENGVFDGCPKDADLDHGVQLVGYATDPKGGDYWTVRNSWGAAWGEAGYIRIKRFSTSDAWCGTDHNPLDGTGCKGGPPTQYVCGMCGILFDTAYPTA
jgi:cathepsin L